VPIRVRQLKRRLNPVSALDEAQPGFCFGNRVFAFRDFKNPVSKPETGLPETRNQKPVAS